MDLGKGTGVWRVAGVNSGLSMQVAKKKQVSLGEDIKISKSFTDLGSVIHTNGET